MTIYSSKVWVTKEGQAPVGVIGNAGTSVSEGIEVEFNIALTDWLTTGVSVATLNSEYDEFVEGPCPLQATTSTCDLSGKTTPMAPEYSGSAYADVFTDVGENLYLTGGITVTFSDSYLTDGALNPGGEQDSYHKIDARIGLTNDDNWSIFLVGKNLTDEATIGGSIPFIGVIGYVQAPRTITLQGNYTF
ncbi:TonB-dependent receptor [Colwellia sp. MSW7]|uniref:TonB-dependent receptor n=1 Tax=Colwellia maritima TaxID=2912588 RepID=A0ABS9X5V2_9GAMM|nr:TonB-dependent receptor [Colwellia maritima]MCI2285599.1 TonB-dependent receptor [Colwellia maritima]